LEALNTQTPIKEARLVRHPLETLAQSVIRW